MRRKLGFVVAAGMLMAPAAKPLNAAQVGALTTDCTAGGYNRRTKWHQFVATCAGRAQSPNSRFAIVQHAYREKQPPIELQDGLGRTLARIPNLSDDMPFSVSWSQDSRWVAVNHHVGSFMDQLRLFEIVGSRLVERTALTQAAQRVATSRYPCLSSDAVLPSAIRWGKDGHHLVMVTISSLYACNDTAKRGDWWPLWMVGDVRTGQIDLRSVRVDKADGPLREPRDEVYRRL